MVLPSRLKGVNPAFVYVTFEPKKEASKQPRATDVLTIKVITPSGILSFQSQTATRVAVVTAVQQLQEMIVNQRSPDDYLPLAQKLYDWLIAPFSSDLEAQEINNLSFIVDRGLRSLPVAALHNGDKFLIEQFSLGIMPSFSLTNTTYQDLRGKRVLAMGAETFESQEPLPAVPIELSTIGQLWTGDVLMNENFTEEKLQSSHASNGYEIIHLATHAEFRPGLPTNSYIQFWQDNRLTLDELPTLKLTDPLVELLVLSSCRTALGDPQAELGFAGLAIKAGVKSALGSLWYVSDAGNPRINDSVL